MTKQKVVHGMKRLEKAFNKEYSAGQAEIWVEKFSKWNEKDFHSCIEGCIERCTFLPTIADVYKQKEEKGNQQEADYKYTHPDELTKEQRQDAEMYRKQFAELARRISNDV